MKASFKMQRSFGGGLKFVESIRYWLQIKAHNTNEGTTKNLRYFFFINNAYIRQIDSFKTSLKLHNSSGQLVLTYKS